MIISGRSSLWSLQSDSTIIGGSSVNSNCTSLLMEAKKWYFMRS